MFEQPFLPNIMGLAKNVHFDLNIFSLFSRFIDQSTSESSI